MRLVHTYILLGLLPFYACDCDEDLVALPTPHAVLVFEEEETPPLPHLEIQLAPMTVGSLQTFHLQLKNDGEGRLDFTDIYLESDETLCDNASSAFSIRSPDKIGIEVGLFVKIAPGASEPIEIDFAPLHGMPACTILHVKTNDPENPILKAVIQGQGDAGALCTDDAVVDFGPVNIGSTKEKDVVLTSCGTRPITVTALNPRAHFPPFGFIPVELPLVLPVNEALTLTSSFTPTEQRAHSLSMGTAGLLSINVDVTGRIYQIAFEGVGQKVPSCELFATPSVINFGTVGEGRTTTMDMVLRNRGELDCHLEAIDLEPTSGSFSVDTTSFQAPHILGPGTYLTLPVTYAPPAALGIERAVVKIFSDDPIHQPLEVPLEGQSQPLTPCSLEAVPSAVHFGYQAIGSSHEREVQITNVGTAACCIMDATISTGNPPFAVRFGGMSFLGTGVAPGDTISAWVDYRPSDGDHHNGNLQIKAKETQFAMFCTSLGAADQTLNIPLSGDAVPAEICVDPMVVDFGEMEVGENHSEAIQISNCGAAPLKIRGFQMRAGSHPDFSWSSALMLPEILAPGASETVSVAAHPQTASSMYGTLEILSDDEDQPSFPVSLRANASACVDGLICQPDPLNFGEVEVAQTLVRSLTCQNLGASTVPILPSANAPFAVLNSPSTIAAGGSATLTVAFSPLNEGHQTRNLNLGATSCDGGPMRIALKGIGSNEDIPPCVGPDHYSPQTLMHWDGQGHELSNSKQIWVTPLVSRLTDTDDDGILTRADVPRIILVTFDHNDTPDISPMNLGAANDPVPGILRAIDGQSGEEIWAVTQQRYRVQSAVTPAVMDIDGDGWPEIIAQKFVQNEGLEDAVGNQTLGKYARGFLIAFEHDGTFKWESDEWIRSENEIEDSSGLSVGDMDGDGLAEVAVGDHVFDHNGRLLFRGGYGTGSAGHGPQSVLLDLDGEAGLELLAGPTAYRANGSLLWHRSDLDDGLSIAADLDADGLNEVILRQPNGELVVLNGQNGNTIAGPILPPVFMWQGDECVVASNSSAGDDGGASDCSPIQSPPAVMDVDGDGDREILVANRNVLLVYSIYLEELWRTEISDQSGASGPVGFDFEGDGRVEPVYSDENEVQVYNHTGQSIYRADRTSVTLAETTCIADVNLDGHANLLLGSNDAAQGYNHGLDMLGNQGQSWVHSRGIWNQHAYVENLVGELGTPLYDPQGMEGLSGFRTATAICRD